MIGYLAAIFSGTCLLRLTAAHPTFPAGRELHWSDDFHDLFSIWK